LDIVTEGVVITEAGDDPKVQLDALTEAKISASEQGRQAEPALLHDLTAATNASDYTILESIT
jgi:hypothetical protein